MKVAFHEIADEEVTEAAQYYESRSPGLGFRFLVQLYRAVDLIKSLPGASRSVGDGLRCKGLDRFPYNVIYLVEEDTLRILAVAHQNRRPGYWRERL